MTHPAFTFERSMIEGKIVIPAAKSRKGEIRVKTISVKEKLNEFLDKQNKLVDPLALQASQVRMVQILATCA
jgi:hypothetical protein